MKYFKSIKGKRVVCSSTNPNPKAFVEITKKQYEDEVRKKEYRLEICKLKSELSASDWIVTKIAESDDVTEIAALRLKYAEAIAERKLKRAKINELETKL